MHQPDDPGQSITNHYHNGNGVNKVMYAVAATFGLVLMTICGVALAKVYDMAERLARVETALDILVRHQ